MDAANKSSRGSTLRWPLAILAIGLLSGLMSLSMSWRHLPAPSLHDEFSNLLLADTLLHGRLANPSPQIWQPFQSFHVLVNPSYASKYPLGPGALLALGWLVFGTPAAGIWIGAGLCAAAVTWAAAGCLPRRWALLAGLLLAISPGVHHQWSLCYMNGWLTAACGALVAGSILRLRKQTVAGRTVAERTSVQSPSVAGRASVQTCDTQSTVESTTGSLNAGAFSYGSCSLNAGAFSYGISYLLLGLGVAGLALTRPFEGLLFTVCCAGLLLYWWRRAWLANLCQHAPRLLAWSAPTIAAAICMMAVHNLSTTGRVTCLPYQLHETQYGVAPLNIFQSPKQPLMTQWSADVPPTVMAFHFGWSLESYLKRNHLAGWCGSVAERLHVVSKLWGLLLCLPIALMTVTSRGAHRHFVLLIALALLVGSFVPWYYSHYFAPSLVWLVILSMLSFVWLAKRVFVNRRALQISFGCLIAIQAIFMLGEVLGANHRGFTWADDRQQIAQRLEQLAGRHLILVRYHPAHNVHDEWVYNGADLEHAPVIWARSWRPDLDEQLLAHYADRQVWLLELDQQDRPTLTPLHY